ncbi:hypothetical protein CLV28_2283 [Sediminihabitans luteus]|uniref:N-acetyltransferase domain-containing protein n=1 Tax=Sediminihabitans luteus TaxID=1138585 RepID=A0A2M9CF02_9CELL|nr:N-acetyltransferase [Sediminihabitans luteus]PJJ70447.1 hypothetical protein CLV28_2283 [Sediminihabitans luteus]GII97920.1 hypothetical protein Slu03_02980 [Sediminihabitans luteus]
MTTHSQDDAWLVVEAPHPSSLDAPEAWAYVGRCLVDAASETALHGWDDLSSPAPAVLAAMADQRHTRKTLLVAVPAGTDPATAVATDVRGFALVKVPLDDNLHLAQVSVVVHPEHDADAALGTALLDRATAVATAAGRTTAIQATMHAHEPAEGPGSLTSPTGSGRVPTDAPAVRRVLDAGWTLVQVERHSILPLPADPAEVEGWRAASAARAGADYRAVTWDDAIPPERLGQVAHLMQRMSTDAPSGEAALEEESWDAERYGDLVDALHAGGRRLLMTVVEHVPTGDLVAFTLFVHPVDQPAFAFQEDTLVLREHRGRRLGMLAKATNLAALAAIRPSVERVHTWNAQENGPMLDINVAMGFAPSGVVALWQRGL